MVKNEGTQTVLIDRRAAINAENKTMYSFVMNVLSRGLTVEGLRTSANSNSLFCQISCIDVQLLDAQTFSIHTTWCWVFQVICAHNNKDQITYDVHV